MSAEVIIKEADEATNIIEAAALQPTHRVNENTVKEGTDVSVVTESPTARLAVTKPAWANSEEVDITGDDFVDGDAHVWWRGLVTQEGLAKAQIEQCNLVEYGNLSIGVPFVAAYIGRDAIDILTPQLALEASAVLAAAAASLAYAQVVASGRRAHIDHTSSVEYRPGMVWRAIESQDPRSGETRWAATSVSKHDTWKASAKVGDTHYMREFKRTYTYLGEFEQVMEVADPITRVRTIVWAEVPRDANGNVAEVK